MWCHQGFGGYFDSLTQEVCVEKIVFIHNLVTIDNLDTFVIDF